MDIRVVIKVGLQKLLITTKKNLLSQ